MARKKRKKSKHKNKKLTRFLTSATVVGAIAVLTFAIDQIEKVVDYISYHRKPSIVAEQTEINYLTERELNQDEFYPLFLQELIPGKHYNLTKACATQVYITNHYKSEIVLSKIKFIAEDIETINEPVLYIRAEEYVGYETLKISNVGWKETGDFHVKLNGIEQELTQYFAEDKLELDVANLKPKEQVEIKIWENQDLKKHPEIEKIFFTAQCVSEKQELEVRYSLQMNENIPYLDCVIYEGGFQVFGNGGDASFLYGIPINTNQKKTIYEETIEEYIKPEEMTTFPICFFPEQSCNLKFHLEFEARYGKKKILLKTEPVDITFETYSSDIQPDIIDITKLTKKELSQAKKAEGASYGLPYPYAENLRRR